MNAEQRNGQKVDYNDAVSHDGFVSTAQHTQSNDRHREIKVIVCRDGQCPSSRELILAPTKKKTTKP